MAVSKANTWYNGNRNVYRGVKDDALAKLLQANNCYEAISLTQHVLVLDERLLMWEGFRRILANETRHVLLSSGQYNGAITGVLSITDFIKVILKIFRQSDFIDNEEGKDLGLITIKRYLELVGKVSKRKTLVWLSTEDSLLEAVRMLCLYRVHRIPVFDPISFDPVGIVTHKRILKFLWCFGQGLFQPVHFIKTPKELGIGTWKGIRVVFPETPLTDCLDILLNLGVSSVPVVEPITLRVVDMYSRFDAMSIALQNEGFKINKTVRQALETKHFCANRCRVVTVKETDTFYTIVTTLVQSNVHRVCVVNNNCVIRGIISLSDVMNALVLEPGSHLNSHCISHKRFSQFAFDKSNMEIYLQTLEEKNTEFR